MVDERFRALHPAAVESRGPFAGGPGVAGLGDGERSNRLPRREPGQPAFALGIAPALGNRERREGVSQERPGQRRFSEHLEGQGHFEPLEAGASVALGNRQAGQADPRRTPPQRFVPPRPAVEDLAQPRRWEFFRRKLAQRRLEQFLLFRQTETHGTPW